MLLFCASHSSKHRTNLVKRSIGMISMDQARVTSNSKYFLKCNSLILSRVYICLVVTLSSAQISLFQRMHTPRWTKIAKFLSLRERTRYTKSPCTNPPLFAEISFYAKTYLCNKEHIFS